MPGLDLREEIHPNKACIKKKSRCTFLKKGSIPVIS